jgi:hypothetical protein
MDQCLAWRCLVCIGCKFCDSCYKQGCANLHIHELKQTDSRHLVPNYTLQVSLSPSLRFNLLNCCAEFIL